MLFNEADENSDLGVLQSMQIEHAEAANDEEEAQTDVWVDLQNDVVMDNVAYILAITLLAPTSQ